MTILTLWAPGISLPASPFDQSTPKKEADRSPPKNESSEIERSALKRRPSQATLFLDRREVCPSLSNFVHLSNVSNPGRSCQFCQILVNFWQFDNLVTFLSQMGYDRYPLSPGLGSGSPGDRGGGDLWPRSGDNGPRSSLLQGQVSPALYRGVGSGRRAIN
jgi:hypothetical protein